MKLQITKENKIIQTEKHHNIQENIDDHSSRCLHINKGKPGDCGITALKYWEKISDNLELNIDNHSRIRLK